MSKIIDFENTQESTITVERTEDFYRVARELSDFIAALPLSQPDNDKLIAIIIQQVQAGEQGAFNQGFRMGIDFRKWEAELPSI